MKRGVYKTVKEELPKVTCTNTEASFQVVNQRGISSKIWQMAREKAEKEYPNPHSRGHKRIKINNMPSALVVYVDEKEQVKESRMKLYNKYGKIDEDGNWPILSNGEDEVHTYHTGENRK